MKSLSGIRYALCVGTARTFLLLTTGLCLLATSSLAFQSGENKNPNVRPRASAKTTASALGVLTLLDKNGRLASDFYRLSFMQIMGLVFFDPLTPDIGSCQKDMLNYHLPELANKHANLKEMEREYARIMADVYTAEELAWMQRFYASPFGERMFKKQMDMNDRITRMMAERYTALKPQFYDMYKIVALRCGTGVSSVPVDAPKLSDEILMPSSGTSAPVAPSPVRQP